MAFLRIAKSVHDHSIEEVYSGLQKSLRRGLIPESLYFARELGTPKYLHLLKKRLILLVLEDVGSISLALQIFDAPNTLLALEYLTVLVASLPKSHITAWLNRYAVDRLASLRQVSTDTIGNLINGKDELQAVIRGTFLRAKGQNHRIFEELEEVCGKSGIASTEKLGKMFKFANNCPLEWIAVILWHTRMEIRRIDDKINISDVLGNALVPEKIDPLPDWVYDKHTRLGKKMKRGYLHFFESSMIMSSRTYPGVEPYESEAKKLYLEDKRKSEQILKSIPIGSIKNIRNLHDDDIQHEISLGSKRDREDLAGSEVDSPRKSYKLDQNEHCAENIEIIQDTSCNIEDSYRTGKRLDDDFEDFLQAQLITRKGNPKVYFCSRKSNHQTAVVKGPDNKYINSYLISQILKERIGLCHANACKMFYEQGTLNSEAGYFLVSDCVGMDQNYDPNKYEVKGKKLESNVKISTNIVNHWNDSLLQKQCLAKNCLLSLAFRKCIGTNDSCDRNLIVHNNCNIISIDDPALWKATDFMWKKTMNSVRKKEYIEKLTENWQEVSGKLKTWVDIVVSFSSDNQEALWLSGFTMENKEFFLNQANHLSKRIHNWKW